MNDHALILESKDSIFEKRCAECNFLKNKARLIVVLLKDILESKVIIQNNHFIARGDEGDMAAYIEPELDIKDGLLSIYYEYTRSNQLYTFGLTANRMEIVYAESNWVHSATGNYENNKYDFIKKEIISSTGNISQDATKTKCITINTHPKSLFEFAEMYEWEVVEGKYL